MNTKEQVRDTQSPSNDPSSRAAFLPRTILPPSPLLHTSFIPSPDEEITIQESIHDIQITLSSVDDEITLSPIRKLPPEIWGEIFLFASAGSPIRCDPRSATDQDDIPLLLCQICSYWRTVAISVPGLWSNIWLNLKNTPSHLSSRVLSVLGLYLARSKNEPLTVSFEGGEVMFTSISETFMAHSERWKDVSLRSDLFFDHNSTLARAKNLRVPSLRRLCIDTTHKNGNSPALSLLEAFEDAPSLRELSLTEFMHPFHYLRVPWSQLTHCSLKRNRIAHGEFTRIMRQMTALVSFSTEGEMILEHASTAPILLPHLRKLSIMNTGLYISTACHVLTVPNLEALTIWADTPFNADQTVAMLRRSGCAPKQLTVRTSLQPPEVWTEHRNVVRLLAAVPTLVCLELIMANAALYFMPQLANRAQSGSPPTPTPGAPLIPALEKLVLEDQLCTSVSGITEVLEWRIVHGASPGLRSIDLRLFRLASPKFDELDSFKRMAEKHGVGVSVFTG